MQLLPQRSATGPEHRMEDREGLPDAGRRLAAEFVREPLHQTGGHKPVARRSHRDPAAYHAISLTRHHSILLVVFRVLAIAQNQPVCKQLSAASSPNRHPRRTGMESRSSRYHRDRRSPASRARSLPPRDKLVLACPSSTPTPLHRYAVQIQMSVDNRSYRSGSTETIWNQESRNRS